MTPTPVGMRCPECSRQKTKVRTVATLRPDPRLTYVLIAMSVIGFLAMTASGGGLTGSGSTVYVNGALNGFAVSDGEWWRIVTYGFLHAGPIHILFNMYVLYFLGTLLEPDIGKARFLLLYVVSLLGGALGALLLSSPEQDTVGASGAVFGLMGATFLGMRARGIDPWQSGIGLMLVLNLGITFVIPNISIGGHIGGLIAGALAGYLMFEVAERRRGTEKPVLVVVGVLCVAIVIACIVVARSAAIV